MPRSFINTVRDYRNGRYFGNDEHNPYVMLTRSGLSIKKVPVKASGSFTKQVTVDTAKEEQRAKDKKPRTKRHKSMHYVSVVTRFYLYLRAPGLDITGSNHRETLKFLENLPISGVRRNKNYDDDDCDKVTNGEDSSTSEADGNDNVVGDGNEELDDFILNVADYLNGSKSDNVNDNAAKSVLDTNTDTSSNVIVNDTAEVERSDDKNVKVSNDNEMAKGGVELIGTGTVTGSDVSNSQNVVHKDLDMKKLGGGPSLQNETTTGLGSSSSYSSSSPTMDQIFRSSFDGVHSKSSSSNKSDNSPYSQTSKSRYLDPSSRDREFPGDLQIQLIPSEHGQNLVKCPECDKAFSMVAAFTAHLKTHFKSRNMCYLCGKVFTRSWLLKGHLRIHTGERPFPCPHEGCNRAFADKSNLRSHLMIHSTNTKNYSCEKCGRAFAQKRYLHKHVQEVCRDFEI